MSEDKPNQSITIFGETNFRNQKMSFGIKRDDRRRHMYIIGKTGMGKTTLLENMIISDVINGEGCCYIDPHGDTAEKILNFIPNHRVNDVIYFNPADMEFPVSFNVLESVDENKKHLIASGLVGVFKKQFAESWGPRLEYILRNAILALLDYPGSTLLGIMRILVDKEYREKVVEKIKDPVVKSFWTNEFTQWNDRVLQEVISPIQNKVGQFLSNMLIRNIVGQVKSTFDLREVIDSNKILILNLSKGRIGEDTMQLIGSMIVTKLYLAAMSRVDIAEKERKDFYLYVDEFQNFANESFADILSEARKYRLNLIIAHQYVEQLPEQVTAAVFGNVGTLISFRVGSTDAEMLVKEYAPVFIEDDLINLPAFHIYLKLMIDGVASDPFSATTLPPLFEDLVTDNNEKVIKVSRERYANPRGIVEDKINRWSGMALSDNIVKATEGEGGGYKPARTLKGDQHEAICASCGNETVLNFKPDGIRPVFCKDCLTKTKEERQTMVSTRLKELQSQDAPPKEVSDKKFKPVSAPREGRPDTERRSDRPRTDGPKFQDRTPRRDFDRSAPKPNRDRPKPQMPPRSDSMVEVPPEPKKAPKPISLSQLGDNSAVGFSGKKKE